MRRPSTKPLALASLPLIQGVILIVGILYVVDMVVQFIGTHVYAVVGIGLVAVVVIVGASYRTNRRDRIWPGGGL